MPERCSQVHEGSLYILENTDLAALSDLGRVTEGLYISMGQRDQLDLSFLSCLHTVDLGLIVANNDLLESTEGLTNLQKLGSLSVTENPKLRVVAGFEQIHEFSLLELYRNPALEKIELDSITTVEFMQIGYCEEMKGAAYNLALVALSGFGGITTVERLWIDGNEALMAANLLDALAINGAPVPLEHAAIRYNPVLSEADVHKKLDVLGVQDREVCGNSGGVSGCICMTGE